MGVRKPIFLTAFGCSAQETFLKPAIKGVLLLAFANTMSLLLQPSVLDLTDCTRSAGFLNA